MRFRTVLRSQQPPEPRCEKRRSSPQSCKTAGHACCWEEGVLVARRVLTSLLLAFGPLAVAGRALGADQVPVPIAERARGAEGVVAGRVSSVTPEWQTNDYGDRLIVSMVRVNVTETMKGESSPTIGVEVEGGTIGT